MRRSSEECWRCGVNNELNWIPASEVWNKNLFCVKRFFVDEKISKVYESQLMNYCDIV